MASKKIVRAIDVGFGNTKFTVSASGDEGGIQTMSFPSIANPVRDDILASGLVDEVNTVKVSVEGSRFEVGFDSLISKSSTSAPILHEEYIRQPQYMALVMGALHYMDVTTVDFLVLGLPVKMMHLAEELKAKVVGVHKISESKTVTVKDCGVLAQPAGALSYFGLNSAPEMVAAMQNSKLLLIDCGYFTVDWLLSLGFSKPDKVRSDSHNSGMSTVLNEVSKQMAQDLNITGYSEFDDIDLGLRTGTAWVYGKQVDMTRYYPVVEQSSQNTINAIKNKVGDGRNIQFIMLSGGSSFAFLPALKQAFPHEIIVIENSVFSNVIGFQLRGEMKFS